MFFLRFALEALGTNVHVLAAQSGGECVVVDPGIGAGPQLHAVLKEHELTPAAVLLTHGHIDHVYGLPSLPEDVPVYIHEGDAHMLADPVASVSPELGAMFGPMLGPWTPPASERIRPLQDGESVEAAGLTFGVAHAPGHTAGSCLLTVADLPDQLAGTEGVESTILSGDVLFAGSIGRTDLPGSDPAAMQRTLKDVVLAQPDTALVFPGHGPATTIGQERLRNPFLPA